MLFNSYTFGLFLCLVWSAYWLLRKTTQARLWLLLAASLVFYGWWSVRFLGLLLFSVGMDWSIGLALGRVSSPRARRGLLALSLVANLGLLGFFKYWGFFAHEANRLLAELGFSAHLAGLDVVLPVGISFYTFQTLSYTIDVYRRELQPEKSLMRFALFVTFFPQLVAGPILRARDFLWQIPRPAVLTRAAFHAGLALVFWGLFKKIAIADFLGRELVDPFWASPATHGGLPGLLAIYGYAFQIYGDFSGYSDIAIGTAAMLGFEVCQNFDAPYVASSPRDFWRRWHISLSTWLRDYLYLPLGGNRKGRVRTYVNLLVTMLLGGLWHGASWMFVLWGAYHGFLLVLDRLLGLEGRTSWIWLRRLVVFHLVCLGWVFFRSRDGAQALEVLHSLGAGAPGAQVSGLCLLVLAIAAGTHALAPRWKQRAKADFGTLPAPVKGVAYAVALGLLMNASGLETPFIYFQF